MMLGVRDMAKEGRGGVHTGSDSMVVQPAHLRLNRCNSSTAGAKEDCILCLFEECSSADIGIDIVPDSMYGIEGEGIIEVNDGKLF